MSRFGTRAVCVLAIVFGSVAAGWSAPKELKTLEIGAEAPAFESPGVDGKTYRLSPHSWQIGSIQYSTRNDLSLGDDS